MLNVIIVGTGEMAASLLLGVKEAGHKVVAIFRNERVRMKPIRRAFRDFFAPSDFYMLAKNSKIPEIKAGSVNSEKFRHAVRKYNADVILVGSWGEKFSQKTINTPKLACINTHPAMLPKYRGPNPYMSAICNGEEYTGITFHLMDTNFDTGAILLQKEVPVLFSDTGYTLKLRCAQTARTSLKELLNGVENGSLTPISQDEKHASYYPLITQKDIYIDFEMSATQMYNKIRGFIPWAVCYLRVRNQFLKIGHAKVIDLRGNEFFVNNKKYFIPDRFLDATPGKVLVKGKNWLLCSTIENNKAILLTDVKLYGFCKQFLTKQFIRSLKKIN